MQTQKLRTRRRWRTSLGEVLLVASPEWHYAWGFLAGRTGDEDREAYNPRCRESWQYLGSFLRGGRYWHEFRHRAHPADHSRRVVHVPAREDWSPGAQGWRAPSPPRGPAAAQRRPASPSAPPSGGRLRIVEGDPISLVEH